MHLPTYVKAYQQEALITEFYNKGEKADWYNKNQYKYCVYVNYYSGEPLPSLGYDVYFGLSSASARLAFIRKEDLLEAIVKFEDVFKASRIC